MIDNKPSCPECGESTAVVRISYGFPTPELLRRAEEGKGKVGGCFVSPDNPNWFCNTCRLRFKKS